MQLERTWQKVINEMDGIKRTVRSIYLIDYVNTLLVIVTVSLLMINRQSIDMFSHRLTDIEIKLDRIEQKAKVSRDDLLSIRASIMLNKKNYNQGFDFLNNMFLEHIKSERNH